ncbi:hypothetical protein FQN50_002621 [Emmonsiellopsis sp. PD_5]|nr:hypothetical protein FQN50_002621 [Emmonsiellopsis sp. PD_5]
MPPQKRPLEDYHVVTLGSRAVGKSTLIHHLFLNHPPTEPEIFEDSFRQIFHLPNHNNTTTTNPPVVLDIFDPVGYLPSPILPLCLANATGLLLVYAADSPPSLGRVREIVRGVRGGGRVRVGDGYGYGYGYGDGCVGDGDCVGDCDREGDYVDVQARTGGELPIMIVQMKSDLLYEMDSPPCYVLDWKGGSCFSSKKEEEEGEEGEEKTSPLTTLPTELLLLITTHLDPLSIISFSLTCSRFYHLLRHSSPLSNMNTRPTFAGYLLARELGCGFIATGISPTATSGKDTDTSSDNLMGVVSGLVEMMRRPEVRAGKEARRRELIRRYNEQERREKRERRERRWRWVGRVRGWFGDGVGGMKKG